MTEYLKSILISQFEASLSMMKLRVKACREEFWEGKVANETFRQSAYHALFYLDLCLTEHEDIFELSNLNKLGGDDREAGPCRGLSKQQTLEYIEFCHTKILSSVGKETSESLQGDSGFSWRKHSRGELHINNIRHFQHHVGQLSTYLRRVSDENNLSLELLWVGMGWK